MANFDLSYAIILKDRFTAVATKVRAEITAIDKKMEAAGKLLEKYGDKHAKLARDMVLPFAAMVEGVKEVMGAADQTAVAEKILSNTLKKHHEWVGKITERAEEYEKVTRFSADATLQAAQTLAQFTKSGKATYESLMPLMDMASATHQDLNSIAMIFAKSVTGATNQMARYGIVIKEGLTPLDKYKALLAGMRKTFSGTAKEMGRTGTGPIIKMGHAIEATWIDIALIVLPTLGQVADGVREIMEALKGFIDRHKTLTKWAGLAVAALVALSTVVISISGLLTLGSIALGALSSGFALLFSPIALIIVAIGAVSFGVYELIKHFAEVKKWIKSVGDHIVNFWSKVEKATQKAKNFLHFWHTTKKDAGATDFKGAMVYNHVISGKQTVKVGIDINDPGNVVKRTNTVQDSSFPALPSGFNMGQVYG